MSNMSFCCWTRSDCLLLCFLIDNLTSTASVLPHGFPISLRGFPRQLSFFLLFYRNAFGHIRVIWLRWSSIRALGSGGIGSEFIVRKQDNIFSVFLSSTSESQKSAWQAAFIWQISSSSKQSTETRKAKKVFLRILHLGQIGSRGKALMIANIEPSRTSGASACFTGAQRWGMKTPNKFILNR